MTTSTVTLTSFLLARIEDDEAVALSVRDSRPEDGHSNAAWAVAMLPEPAASHVLNWGPNRVLAECAAKRAIVERHSSCDDVSFGDASTCPDLVALAAVFADHPDYDESWRP